MEDVKLVRSSRKFILNEICARLPRLFALGLRGQETLFSVSAQLHATFYLLVKDAGSNVIAEGMQLIARSHGAGLQTSVKVGRHSPCRRGEWSWAVKRERVFGDPGAAGNVNVESRRSLKNEIERLSTDYFVALILDNEVTVGEFVTDPPLPWTRLVQQSGIYQVAAGYPTELTSAQAKFEMRNWDEVSLPAIIRGLAELDSGVGCVVFGNNAGQGLPLAQSLAPNLIGERAAIIYAQSLPEQSGYEQLGYRTFLRRSETVSRLLALAKKAGQPLALCFVNTIQHNQHNYHDP